MSLVHVSNPAPTPRCFLDGLPDEILLQILEYLDIPDLLIVSRLSHHLRLLSLDPLLHTHRLLTTRHLLTHLIPHRPPLTHLIHHHIYLSRTCLLAKSLSLSLTKIKLNRRLDPKKRPSVERLVELGILPGGLVRGVSRGVWEVGRKVEREWVRDRLRGWVGEWRVRRDRRGRVVEGMGGVGMGVGVLVRRFGGLGVGVGGGGECGMDSGKEMPTRAKVLGLRRFFEGQQA